MKILLLGDASNYHATLSRALSAMGHDVTVASNGSRWMDTSRHIDLSRKPGVMGGALLWARLSTILRSRLKGYDIVQIVNPVFVELRPERVSVLFDRLKRDNGKVVLTALGTDTQYINMCTRKHDSPLAYNEWRVDGHPTPYADEPRGRAIMHAWTTHPLDELSQRVYDQVDGVVSALYEYHLAAADSIDANRLTYGGIPVDTSAIPFTPPTPGDPVKILAPYHTGRESEKGTDILYNMARRVAGARIDRITGLRYNDFVARMATADVVLDQFYSYTPATTALVAMAMGKTVVTGGERDFAAWIGDDVPVVNPDPRCPERLVDDLTLAMNPETMAATAVKARRFVEKHNDASVVAQRFVDFWSRI